METGISVYPGLGGTIQEKTARIERAAALGMTRLFTAMSARHRRRRIAGLGSLPGHGPFRSGSYRQAGHYNCPL